MPYNPSSATRLADFGSGIGTAGATISVDTATKSFIVGSATTNVTLYGNTGFVSATKYYGDGSSLTGIDATSLKDSGANIKVQATTSGATVTGILTATNLTVTSAAEFQSNVTINGNLQINGTQTTINSTSLDIVDKTVGIASLTTPTNSTADGAGIVVYGGLDGDKKLTWDNSSKNWILSGGGLSVSDGRLSANDYEGNFILDSFLFN